MRSLLLMVLVATGTAKAEVAMWSVGQTAVSQEYVFCKTESDCLPRTVKVMDLDRPHTGISRSVVDSIPKQHGTTGSVTVQFKLASAILDEKARADLGLLVREARPAQAFVVTGMTDKLGFAAFNRRLAKSRAKAVQKFLLKSGVPAARIVLAATCCVDHPPIENPSARRAVVRLSGLDRP